MDLKGTLRGTGCAIVTPFTKDGEIDFPALGKLIDHLIGNGVNYIVSLGTTGETPVLSSSEKKGIVQFTEEELVSADYIGNPHSCILDSKNTNVVDGTMVKVSGWYDNEFGYASRCVDLVRFIGARL